MANTAHKMDANSAALHLRNLARRRVMKRGLAVSERDDVKKAIDSHLKQWSAIGERMQKMMTPVLKQQEQMQKALRPFIESQLEFQKSLEPMLSKHAQWQSSLARSLEFPTFVLPDLGPLALQAAHFRKALEDVISPAFEGLQRSFKELPPRTQEAVLLLGAHGWFLDLEMPLPSLWELKNALEAGNIQEAEDALIEYFEERLREIEESITRRFPSRAKVIRSAFAAHRHEEYELSIPVLLSQTDGICKEVVNEHFFIKQNKKPRTAIYVEQVAADTYQTAILSPLAHNLPIAASEKERAAGSNQLNRHMVLHGESLDYGTRTNSLKSVSLINYVVHVLKSDANEP